MNVLTSDQHPGQQLWHEIGDFCRERMEAWRDRRDRMADLATWQTHREQIRQIVLDGFPAWFFERDHPLNVKVVSQHDFGTFRIENVLFDAFPGWDVNATVYLPPGPGPHPAVVCPTGSSTKMKPTYQRAAQVFARNGYIAVSFDPPGFVGEKAELNNVFDTGFTGTLVGFWSNAYVVLPALRALDYLDSRDDVNHAAGYAVSGLSLGGTTTNYCGFMDDRIRFFAPVGCYKPMLEKGIKLKSDSSPFGFGHGFLRAGLDHVDITCLAAPKPCLIIGGARDVIFDPGSARQAGERVRHIYDLYGRSDDFSVFIDEDGDHEYTIRMASRVVEKMNRCLLGTDDCAATIVEDEIVTIPDEQLRCHPVNRVTLFTMNRDEAIRLAEMRQARMDQPDARDRLSAAVKASLGLEPIPTAAPETMIEPGAPAVWYHRLEKIDFTLPAGQHVPALLLSRIQPAGRVPALLFIDEHGKWNWLKQGGPLTAAARFLEPQGTASEPLILSLDVSGWGELAPDPTPFALAPWVSIERHIAYLSNFAAKPVMGLRVRDALAALAFLRTHSAVDPSRILVGGRGAGAIVALLTAAIDPGIAGVVGIDMLSHYGAIASQHPQTWREDVFIPNVLRQYDLPEVAAALAPRPVRLLNLQDAARQAVSQAAADSLYESARRSHLSVRCGLTDREVARAFVQFAQAF